MSRRAPPPEYFEEDEYEFKHERPPRSRRRDRDLEDDVEYHRRRSMPPIKDMEGLRIRERPPRERDRMGPRKSRDDMAEDLSGSELDEVYVRPRPRRRSHVSRDLDEDIVFDERERRRYRPREIDDEELIAHDREPHRSRKYLPREMEEELVLGERGRRLPPRRRSREVEEEELIDEMELRGSRKHRPREIDEEELIAHGREPRGSRKHRPREIDDEELVLDDRDRHLPPRRGSRGLDEEDFIIGERKGHGRKHRPPEFDEVDEEELIIDNRDRRRRYRADRDLEEDTVAHRRKRYPPRPYDSEGDLRLRETRFEDEREDVHIPPRRRPRHREPEVDEVLIDERERDRPRGRKYREELRPKEEVIMRWKDRPSSRELDDDEELHMREIHHRRRRSHPEPRHMREPPGAWPEDEEDDDTDENIRIRSRTRSRPHRPEVEEDHIIHRGKPGLERRRGSADSEEIMLHREERRSPPRERSPSVEPVRAPPVHQDFITHHRHIDHGFDPPPRAPSPEASSTRTSFDEVDVRHRGTKDNQEFGDPLDDESVSPTSGPSIDFHNPWRGDQASVRSKPRSLPDDQDSVIAASSYARSNGDLPRGFDIKEKLSMHDKASLVDDAPKDAADEWSVVHSPSKTEALEMTGALDIIEVAPKASSEPEIEVEEEESRVAPKISKETKPRRDERWTEITKDLVVREAIEQLGYEFEETRAFYYIFSYLDSTEIDELVELSDDIRRARRRRIREMQRERSSIPPRPASLIDRIPPRPQMPARPRMPVARRVRDREWLLHGRR